jgi:hypothetical protein
MATPSSPLHIPSTIDTFVLNTTLANYAPTLTDNAYNANVLLSLLNRNKDLKNGGGSIVEPLIESEQDEGGFYLGADVLNNTQANTLTQVEYKWQNVYEPIQITRDEELDNSGDAQKILDLASTKTLLSEKAIAKRMDQALSTPVGAANNLVDLETMVDSTGILGSIDGGTDTFWSATETASGAFATQGLTDMTTAYYAVSSGAAAENPTDFMTNKTIFQKFEQTRLPLERISNVASANAGFENLTFKGRPLMYGNFIGTGLMFGLNMNYIKLAVHSASDMVTTQFIEPTNQTTKVAYILWRGNMVTNNRRRNFKLTGIT